MKDQLFLTIMLLIGFCGVAGTIGIVRARRKRETTYYWVSGVTFLVALAGVVALLEQFLLSMFMIISAALLSIVLLPRTMELQRQEILKQKQETDISAPLQLRDFWNLQGWIKLKARYGFRKTVILYSIVNIGIGAAIMLAFVAIGLFTTLIAVFYVIFSTAFSILILYRQLWKALKDT